MQNAKAYLPQLASSDFKDKNTHKQVMYETGEEDATIIDLCTDDIDEIDPEIKKSIVLSLEPDNKKRTVEVLIMRSGAIFTLNEVETVILADSLTCQIQEWRG